MSELKPGNSIRVKPEGLVKGQEWKKGSVIKSHVYRSYAVEVDGKVLKRNRVHLKQEKQITPAITEHKSKAKGQDSAQQNTKVKLSRPMTPKIAEPAKCATKMELITPKRTSSGRLVKTPKRYFN